MTATRALVAVGFVAAVSGLLALRGAGYLGGRERGGPLRVTFGPAGRGTARLRGGPVRVQGVRVRVTSPGLAVAEPSFASSGQPLEDAVLRAGRTRLRTGLAADRPGVYYAVGLVTDYRRGQRRFRDRSNRVLCLAVGSRRRCDPAYRGPGAARVAQVGGPGRYPGARLGARAATYRRTGTYRARVTLLNRTRSPIEVRDLEFARAPRHFALRPRGSRAVRLVITVRSCARRRVRRLRAEVDGERGSIPLSLPLRVRCAG